MRALKGILFGFYILLFWVSLIINYVGKILIIISLLIIGDFNTISKKIKTLNNKTIISLIFKRYNNRKSLRDIK